MNRNLIASELLTAAKEMTAGRGATKYVTHGNRITVVSRNYYYGDLTRREANDAFDTVEDLVKDAVKILNKWTAIMRGSGSTGYSFKRNEPILQTGFVQGDIVVDVDDDEGFIMFLEKNGIKKL